MPITKVLEQDIAVFGESGSGKTVMLSAFYGSEQESQNIRPGTFNVVAENPSQGTHLHQNYLGMKNSAKVPAQNRFASTSYNFVLRLKGSTDPKLLKNKPFSALRLTWHDYPGEWFEQDVSGSEEAQRRLETFRALLGSHVALLLVDGQKLVDNVGEEERYLKSLMGNLRNSLLLLKDDLLENGEPLVTFPRIWVIALSKADLLPDLDVHAFRELVVEKVGDEIVILRTVLGEMVESDDALSIGEDFVLISSAKFSSDAIEVAERLGLDLILPLAAMLPFERHVRWSQAEKLSKNLALELLTSAQVLASALGVASGFAAALMTKKNKVIGTVGLALSHLGPALESGIKTASTKLEAANVEAATKRENLVKTLEGFRKDLDNGESAAILVRSRV
jgi:hypothetical protein